MAVSTKNPILLYNFNEGSIATIRDYSQEGNDGTGTNLTVAASSRVGNNLIFNGTTGQLTKDSFVLGVDDKLSYFMAISFTSNTATDYVFNHNGVCFATWDGTTLSATLTTSVSTYTVTNDITPLTTATAYDIFIAKTGTNLFLVIDGVLQTATALSGTVTATANDLYIGHNAGATHSAIKLNEFKVFDTNLSLSNDAAFRGEQNGVLMNTALTHDYNLGDIIAGDITSTNIKTAIVTYVGDYTEFRIQPISDDCTGGIAYGRVGHLWDVDRQWRFTINNAPEICFYDGIALTTDIFLESKKVYCLTKEGIIDSSTSITTTYQVLSTDQIIYVDSSGGAFTITLESAPTTNRQFTIIDSTGSCGANTVTINGNGKNIQGNSTGLLSSDYQAWNLVYNGTQWNLK